MAVHLYTTHWSLELEDHSSMSDQYPEVKMREKKTADTEREEGHTSGEKCKDPEAPLTGEEG